MPINDLNPTYRMMMAQMLQAPNARPNAGPVSAVADAGSQMIQALMARREREYEDKRAGQAVDAFADVNSPIEGVPAITSRITLPGEAASRGATQDVANALSRGEQTNTVYDTTETRSPDSNAVMAGLLAGTQAQRPGYRDAFQQFGPGIYEARRQEEAAAKAAKIAQEKERLKAQWEAENIDRQNRFNAGEKNLDREHAQKVAQLTNAARLEQERIAAAATMGAAQTRADAQADATKNRVNASLTPAERAVDAAFGRDYNALVLQGGLSDISKGIVQLKDVTAKLESGANLTGPGLGLMPDAIKGFTHPASIAARDAVEEVVQRNLRLILGGQFAQLEAANLIARAYNQRLPEAENAKRLKRLTTAMEMAMNAKVAAIQYYEQNGTMVGYQGKTKFSIADFEAAIDGKSPPTPGSEPPPGVTGGGGVGAGGGWIVNEVQ